MVREEEYVPPPVENSIPLPIPAPAPCCQGSHTTLPALEEITEELSFIVRATAPDQRDAISTPGRSPAAGTRLPSTRTREGHENKEKGVFAPKGVAPKELPSMISC